MTLLRANLWATVLVLCACSAQAQNDSRKANKAEAKRLMQLAQAAEKQGKLLEARGFYLQAEGAAADKSSEDGLKRVNEQVAAKVKTMSASAGSAYQLLDFAKTSELLESA